MVGFGLRLNNLSSGHSSYPALFSEEKQGDRGVRPVGTITVNVLYHKQLPKTGLEIIEGKERSFSVIPLQN